MQITIKELLTPTLQRIAKENGLTPEQYASNIVQSFLEAQYRGEVMDEIKKKPVEELAIIKANLINTKNYAK